MVEQFWPQTAIVTLKELGINCWLPKRFVEGGSRCDRFMLCKYPERETCRAIDAELAHLQDEQAKLLASAEKVGQTIKMLENMLENRHVIVDT